MSDYASGMTETMSVGCLYTHSLSHCGMSNFVNIVSDSRTYIRHLRAPAVHRFAKELPSSDEHGKQYQETGCILAVQSVDQVVVEAEFEVAKVERRFHETVHSGDDGGSLAAIAVCREHQLLVALISA